MGLPDRDKKILLMVVPVVFVLAYWFVLLAPKREEASKAAQELAAEEKKRDDATAKAAHLESAKATFARDYRDVVRLGKAIPSNVDTPSLIVQLDSAARGTGIKFTRIKTGERAAAPAGGASGAQSGSGGSGSGGSGSTPASGGSEPAQSQPGSAAQTANKTANDASQQAGSSSQTGDNATDTSTSSASKSGGLPVGGGASAAGGQAATGAAPGLDSVPLEFTFDGSFFDLADFFHRLKRFVRVTNKDVLVRGRLMTIDGMKFATSEQNTFPDLSVEVAATVYLSPKAEGTTAGASPGGPARTQTAAAPSDGSAAASPPPTATATP